MKYLYYKSKKGNFGDDLNGWLWPKIFNNNTEGGEGYFLGIGSILYNENPSFKNLRQQERKIVFGSGVRPSPKYTKFKTDNTWDIRFLRGPLSSEALDNKYKYITDAAYALRQLPEFKDYLNCEKKYEVSLMPYFHSEDYLDWRKICKELGFHYISPHSENGVEATIRELASSKRIVTEAMHGAIVADIVRVPWHRFILTTPFTEGPMVSEFKWSDWLKSVEITNPDVTYIPFYSKTKMQRAYTRTVLYEKLNRFSSFFVSAEFLFKNKVRKELISKLSGDLKYYISDDKVVQRLDQELREEIELLRSELVRL